MTNETETRTYTVPDMSCGHCVSAVTAVVRRLDGVESVDVSLETKQVTVRGGSVDDAEVRAAIEEAGYEAVA